MKTLALFAGILLLAIQVSAATTPPAGTPKRLVLVSEVEITVEKYEKDADVYVIANNAEPEVGPNYVTPEALKKAVGSNEPLKDFKQKIKSGTVFTLKRDLQLLWLKEFEQRKKSNKG